MQLLNAAAVTKIGLMISWSIIFSTDQEDCGSCWTFGTTAAVEGALARVNGGKLLALSNQAIVDCAWA